MGPWTHLYIANNLISQTPILEGALYGELVSLLLEVHLDLVLALLAAPLDLISKTTGYLTSCQVGSGSALRSSGSVWKDPDPGCSREGLEKYKYQ